jgi:hypothetical protein
MKGPQQMLFIAYHSVFLIGFATTLVFAGRTIVRRRNTSANVWRLPFAYLSLSAWALWIFQYVILVAGPFILVSSDSTRTTGLWLGVIQNVAWVIAVLSLHTKLFSKTSLTMVLLLMIAVIVALISFQTTILTLDAIKQIDALATATIFTVLALSILRLRVSKLAAAAFVTHGYLQWIWRELWFTENSIMVSLFPVWYFGLLIVWRTVILEMLVTFRVMISSTVKDLTPEREAAERAIRSLNLEGFRAETIGSRPYTPKKLCSLWAEQCNAFVLIIGERYGHVTKSKKSAVEFEFEVAYKQDPEKIFAYVKDGVTRERELEEFYLRLRDFDDGYIDTLFTTPDELAEEIKRNLSDWLAEVKQKRLAADQD